MGGGEGDMIGSLLNMLSGTAFSVLDLIMSALLPTIEFNFVSDLTLAMDNEITLTILSWVNYFLPINMAARLVTAWAAMMLAWFTFKLIWEMSRSAI